MGITHQREFLEQSVEEWQKNMDADLKSVYVVCKAAAEQMGCTKQGRKDCGNLLCPQQDGHEGFIQAIVHPKAAVTC
jgi:NAD(P)-dependent dehydrogenase (short-subunit alcohol dehydrogenase family)